jgi:hypothetical protein
MIAIYIPANLLMYTMTYDVKIRFRRGCYTMIFLSFTILLVAGIKAYLLGGIKEKYTDQIKFMNAVRFYEGFAFEIKYKKADFDIGAEGPFKVTTDTIGTFSAEVAMLIFLILGMLAMRH